MKTVKLDVEGMHCKSCEMLIIDEIEELDGVRKIEASHEKNQVVVEFDEKKVTDDMIIKKISEEGYKVI